MPWASLRNFNKFAAEIWEKALKERFARHFVIQRNISGKKNMAITPVKKAQKQKHLLIIFGGLVLVTLFVIWRGSLKSDTAVYPADDVSLLKQVGIDFETLEKTREFRDFRKIEPLPLEEEKGRSNPFIPYYLEKEEGKEGEIE